jgi:hypothetical protein
MISSQLELKMIWKTKSILFVEFHAVAFSTLHLAQGLQKASNTA